MKEQCWQRFTGLSSILFFIRSSVSKAPFSYVEPRWLADRRCRSRGPKQQRPRGPHRRFGNWRCCRNRNGLVWRAFWGRRLYQKQRKDRESSRVSPLISHGRRIAWFTEVFSKSCNLTRGLWSYQKQRKDKESSRVSPFIPLCRIIEGLRDLRNISAQILAWDHWWI